jgi:2-polyprenyl-6-hydroxyphenyl methylase / 3-demethylubiquinone-9 3-methyltransferase
MAERGATVTGIDLADKPLKVAQLHLLESGHEVEYMKVSAEELARNRPGHYDVVTCMELLEHVPDPAATVRACAELVKPDGWIFFATINRNPKAYLFAVIGAEYVLKLLPRGTHDYAKFIRPSELAAMCRDSDLSVAGITGMTYNPLTRIYSLGGDTDVNYILHARK